MTPRQSRSGLIAIFAARMTRLAGTAALASPHGLSDRMLGDIGLRRETDSAERRHLRLA